MLAGLSDATEEVPSPAWFADSEAAVINPHPMSPSDRAAIQRFVGPRLVTELEWIVRLDPNVAEQVGSLADIDALLSTPSVEVRAVRGLGLAGLVQLRTLTASDDIAQRFFEDHPLVDQFARNSTFTASLFPNDPEFGNQTSLESTGQFGTLIDADVDAAQAWETSTGRTNVVVGIIDSGIDLAHPDLYLNIWINQGEISAAKRTLLQDIDQDNLITFYDLNDARNASLVRDANRNGYIDARDLLGDPRWTDGVDTDRNGFVDDFFGWNFRDELDEPFEPNDPADTSGHGSHVSGIIGAVGNNGTGIAGINWRTSLMALKFLDQNNQGDVASAIAAVNYATMMRSQFATNVRVLNNSWGQAGSFNSGLNDALAAAENAEILVVAAAGNGNVLGVGVDNDRTPFYPSSYPHSNILSVAASDGHDRPASFSNYGATSVDLFAPGVGIRSTLPGGRYGDANGTSMSTPLVAGAAALIWSALPRASATEVRHAILTSVDSVDIMQALSASGGRLNVSRAIASPIFAPTAELVQAIDVGTAGSTSHEFTIRFNDRTGLDLSTLGDDDIHVMHKWGDRESLSARLVPGSVSANAAGTEATATYQITPPGGAWDVFDFGNYEIVLAAQTVRSLSQSTTNRQQTLGQFRVQITAPDVIYVNSFRDDLTVSSLRSAVAQSNAHPERNFTVFLDTGRYQLELAPVGNGGLDFTPAGLSKSCASGSPVWSNNDSGDLDVLGHITILGDNVDATSIASQTGDRLFKVHATGSLTLKRLSLRGGTAPDGQAGGAILSAGDVHLERVQLFDNSAAGDGASSGRGGAIAAWSGAVAITQSHITENQADIGGGIFACDTTQLTISNSTFDNNRGGGIVSYADSNGTIDNSTLGNNLDGAVISQARDFAGGNGASSRPSISLDGRYLSFLSEATNLVASDTNNARDAFLFDRSSESMQRLSVSNAGLATQESVDGLVLSGNGQQVAFLTQANNLISGDSLRSNDVFVRSWNDAVTSLVSTGPTTRASRGTPALSADGRFVAYQQTIANDPFNTWAVYVADRQLGTTERINLNAGSFVAKIDFLDQTLISGDGRFVMLSSRSSGTADDLFHEIILFDRSNQTLQALPVRPANSLPNGSLYAASISGDGRTIAFASDDTGLVAGDTNGYADIFVFDRLSSTTRRVSQTTSGAQANGPSDGPAISNDGRFVAFTSHAFNLVANDQNGLADVFMIDTTTSAVERISVGSHGTEANGASGTPALSGDGRYVVYESSATNLVDSHPNHRRNPTATHTQIFLRDRLTGRTESISSFELNSTLRVTNSTLAYNTGESTLAGNVTVHNSLLAGNRTSFDLGAGVFSSGSNIFASANPRASTTVSDRLNSDSALKLGPLTVFQFLPPGYPLLQGNPAIDTGASQAIGTLDQWNRLRLTPDVGALETVHGSVSGQVYADLNGNMQRDAGEPGLSNELLFIDSNNDGTRQPNELAFTSLLDTDSISVDRTGQYRFDHLTPGSIIVRAQVPDQWVATPPPILRVTAGSVQGNGPSSAVVIGPSGNTLAFLSTSTNFTPNDDASPSIFLYSRDDNSLVKIPVAGANLRVLDIAGPQDRYVLLRNDTGVYLWDRQQQTLQAVSVSSSGQLANAHSDHAAMSDDGRWIAFSSFANNLIAGDTDAFADTYLLDRDLGTLISLTQQGSGTQGNNDSEAPSMSADGQIIAFVSDASNLVAADTNSLGDIFVFSQATQSLRRINLSETGAQSNGFTYPPQVSGNGRFVVFQSLATNLVPNDQNTASDLFVVDLQSGSVERLDIPWRAAPPLVNINPSISFDGQYVSFEASELQLNHPAATAQMNIFVYDRYGDQANGDSLVALLGRDEAGVPINGDSRSAMLSQDSRWIAFHSTASNIVTGDTNSVSDIFLLGNPFEDASRRAALAAGQALENLDFALTPVDGSISGTLFNDISEDGVYDAGDPTLSGWILFLDANANGRRDVNERFTTSLADGTYSFTDVPAYREHVLSVELPGNWDQVAPERVTGQPRLFLPAGGKITGRDFGFRVKTTTGQSENARIDGRIFNDLNNNGVQNSGEPALSDVEVYLDLNGNERRDFGEPRTLSDSLGNYSFTGLGSRNYAVRMVLVEGSLQTSPLGNRFSSQDQVIAAGSTSLSKPQDIAVADLDGRHGPDLATAFYLGNSLVVQLNDGLGGFTAAPAAIPLPAGGSGPIAIASGQLNQQGHADLVLANSLSQTLSVLFDFDGATFTQQRTLNVGAAPLDVLVVDIDADGDNDIAVSTQIINAATPAAAFLGQLRLFLNDGSGQFSAGTVTNSGGKRAVALSAADLNRDNILDIVIANQGDFGRNGDVGSVAILLGRGSGTFAPAVTYVVGSTPLDVAIADLNGDGHLDVTAVNFALNTASLLRGDSSGTVQVLGEQISVGQGPVQVELLDIEGDNDTDLLITNLVSRSVSIVRNRRSQISSNSFAFEPADNFGVAKIPIGARLSFAAADLDQSGTIDLAIINSETNSLNVLRNSIIAGANRLQSNGTNLTANQNFGVRFETLLPKMDPLVGPTSIPEDSAPMIVSLTGIARGRSSGPPLRFSASSSAPDILSAADVQHVEGATTGHFVLTTARDAVGQAVITVEVRDAGADQQFQTADDGLLVRTLAVRVTAVNDAPTFRVFGNQVISIGSSLRTVPGFANGFGPGGGTDEAGQAIADYLISVDRPDLFLVQPAIDIQGTLRYQPNLTTTGIATVNVQVKDNGGTESGGNDRSAPLMFQISVIDLADGDIDFGDAPAVYPVALRANGARHKLSPLFLGAAVDSEPDGRISSDATGDDNELDDEDGIRWVVPPIASRTQPTQTSLLANASKAGRIDAWIDFNQDGDWNDSGEQILSSAMVVAGANWLSFTVPAGSAVGSTFARVRLSSSGGLAVVGLAEDGEVEDYRLNVLDAGSATPLSIVVAAADIPAHEAKLIDGQFVVQSGTQTLVSVPASSLANWQLVSLIGANVYSIMQPARNLVGVLNFDDRLSTSSLVISSQSLDLTALTASAFDGVQRLELVSSAAQQLSFVTADLAKLNASRRLELVIGSGHIVNTNTGWEVIGRQQVDGSLLHTFRSLGQLLVTQSPANWHNPLNVHDVSGDGLVTPLDALLIINILNQRVGSNGELPQFDPLRPLDHAFYDVTGSNTIEPLDVLLVINVLNS